MACCKRQIHAYGLFMGCLVQTVVMSRKSHLKQIRVVWRLSPQKYEGFLNRIRSMKTGRKAIRGDKRNVKGIERRIELR